MHHQGLDKGRPSLHQTGNLDGENTSTLHGLKPRTVLNDQRKEKASKGTRIVNSGYASQPSFTGIWPSSIAEEVLPPVGQLTHLLGGRSWTKGTTSGTPASASLPQVLTSDIVQSATQASPARAVPVAWASSQAADNAQTTMEGSQSFIGFGVVKTCSKLEDATDAAFLAIQDALKQCSSSFSIQSSDRWQAHIKLGVPSRPNNLRSWMELMSVDVPRLWSMLPAALIMKPVETVVGGLLVEGNDSLGTINVCSVVASVTIQRVIAAEPSNARASVAPLTAPPQLLALPVGEIKPPRPGKVADHDQSLPAYTPMDLLARISEEVRENRAQTLPPAAAPIGILGGLQHQLTHSAGSITSLSDTSDDTIRRGDASKKTHGSRKYVQHNYTDHRQKKPKANEGELGSKNLNAAFPIKLHEVLSKLEQDDWDNTMSWQPHGRSFGIHKPEEFVKQILPQYFVMTKKSSFLRQLNLYGFQRISAGPDKGTYYHELFLRGMPFLCRRMTRIKVNGKRVRAAGNPDQEPNFYTMAPLPLGACKNAGECHEIADTRSSPALSSLSSIESSQVIRSQALSNHLSFPAKLQCMLDTLEAEGEIDIISWLPHGRAFFVKQQERFAKELMPKFFRQTKYSSFQRQLHMYSFQRITSGPDKGAYYHKDFLRQQQQRCRRMVRTRINGKGCRQPGNPKAEPDFRGLPPVTRDDESTCTDESSEDEQTKRPGI